MTITQLKAKRIALNTHIAMCEASAAQCLANGDRDGWQFYADEAGDAATLRDDVVGKLDALENQEREDAQVRFARVKRIRSNNAYVRKFVAGGKR